MKTKIVLTAAVLFCGASLALQAQDLVSTNSTYNNNSDRHWYQPDWKSTELYHNWEVSLDAFGVGTIDEHSLDHLSGHRISRHGQLGAGAGLEFFFNKYVGIEAEGFSESTHHNFVDNFGGNLVLRWPIGETGFSPYIFGGGGHQFDPGSSNYGDGGAGLEYRFTHCFGIFADGRYVATHNYGNYAMGRLGVRFTF